MAFFKTSAGVPDHEKARLEFHIQQVSESIGSGLMQIPVVDPNVEFMKGGQVDSLDSILQTVGRQLNHDMGSLNVKTQPQELKKCGSGG